MSQARSFVGQGSNSSLVGDYNARVILTALRRAGAASKADLSRLVGLTQNATGLIVRRLEQAGLVRATGKRQGERGQPATLLELNPEGAFSIGVRIDRTVLQTVLVDLHGQILDRDTLETLPEPEAAMTHLSAIIARMTGGLPPEARARLTGIGVATPYDLDSWLRELDLPAARFRRWGGFDVAAALARATSLNVTLENDGSAAAIGELIYGHGREIADFLYVFIGPALGGGVVLGGDYFRGSRRNAGDLGVIPVPPSRLDSAPAGQGTLLMARASLSGLTRHLRHHGAPQPAAFVPARFIETHQPLFDAWAEDAASAMALPVLTASHLLDVGHVVIAGDLPTAALERIAALVAAAMQALVAERRTAPVVLAGQVGPWAASVGAASLPLHDSFSPTRDHLTGTADPQEARA